MAVKILVTGDVVLGVNSYTVGRMTPDSTEAGTRVIKTAGGVTIAHALLHRLAGMKTDPRPDLGLTIGRGKSGRLHWLELVD